MGLKLHGTHQLLVYADDVKLLGDNTDTIKKNTETLTGASKEVGLEVNTKKTKYMLLSHQQNTGQNHDIKMAIKFFENVALFRYLGTTIIHQNFIQEEIKWMLNSSNACYHSRQKLLSSCLLSKIVKIRIYKTKILPMGLHGCETWFLTLREEHRLRVFVIKIVLDTVFLIKCLNYIKRQTGNLNAQQQETFKG
jgi:hypothetical protein